MNLMEEQVAGRIRALVLYLVCLNIQAEMSVGSWKYKSGIWVRDKHRSY